MTWLVVACAFLPVIVGIVLLRLWYREDKAEEAEIARERAEAEKARRAKPGPPA